MFSRVPPTPLPATTQVLDELPYGRCIQTVKRLRVLVVDDNEASAITLAWAIEAHGHETLTCHNGQEAVALVKTFKPDAILLDIGMPVMSGLEACRHIRAAPNGVDHLIIAQTAWGDDEAREETTAAGFDLHLVKPLDIDVLVQHLHHYRANMHRALLEAEISPDGACQT